jgi:subtilisin-like proprotein convertase family protein
MRRNGTGTLSAIALAAVAILALPAAGQAATFTSTSDTLIQVPPAPVLTASIADPYPSAISVPAAGTVSEATVTLLGVNHASPDDLDVALVSPSGAAVTLMSDACELDGGMSRNLTFDDDASAALPNSGNCGSVDPYKPSNYIGGDEITVPFDPFPAPGPSSSNVVLSTFEGGPSNGAWHLYVFDDGFNNSGSLAGWTLNLEYVPAPPAPPGPPAVTGQRAAALKKCAKKKGKKKKKKCKKRAKKLPI